MRLTSSKCESKAGNTRYRQRQRQREAGSTQHVSFLS